MLDTPVDKPLDMERVNEAMEDCGAFSAPLVLALRHRSVPAGQQRQAVARVALDTSCRSRVSSMIDPAMAGIYDDFYPADVISSRPTTNDAIDTFLHTYGRVEEGEEELLRKLIFNPVPDYASTLERQGHDVENRVRDNQDDRLDAFLQDYKPSGNQQQGSSQDKVGQGQSTGLGVDDANDAAGGNKAVAPGRDVLAAPARDALAVPGRETAPKSTVDHDVDTTRDATLSQSLARIFIKEKNYTGAYQIIEALSLKNPDKSIYFADQLRFLRKLMAYQEAVAGKH